MTVVFGPKEASYCPVCCRAVQSCLVLVIPTACTYHRPLKVSESVILSSGCWASPDSHLVLQLFFPFNFAQARWVAFIFLAIAYLRATWNRDFMGIIYECTENFLCYRQGPFYLGFWVYKENVISEGQFGTQISQDSYKNFIEKKSSIPCFYLSLQGKPLF